MKKILFTLAALSLASFTFAQDFDFGGDDSGSGDSFGGGFEESSTPTVSISGEVGADARAWIGAPNKDNGAYDTKGYKDFYDLSKTELGASAHANVDLSYAGDYTDANIKFKLNPNSLKKYHEDIIDEVSFGGSFKEGKFQLRAGKMKEVWGKGDKVHVLDNFNANDYTDFIFPDYIDRRIGEVMFKATANLSWDYNIKLEGIFTPWMTADRFADSGKLVPASQTALTNSVTDIVTNEKSGLLPLAYGEYATLAAATGAVNAAGAAYQAAGAAYQAYIQGGGDPADTNNAYYVGMINAKNSYEGMIAKINQQTGKSYTSADEINKAYEQAAVLYLKTLNAASSLDTNSLYPDTFSLRYGQAGLRITGTLAGIDWGASYYYGHYKQPSINRLKIKPYMVKYLAGETIEESDKFLQYDQLQVFGLEAAFVLWKFNTRWEFAYNLTEDTAGDDPWVRNNSIAWVAGFDIDIPLHNLNLNVQDNGTFILNSDKIKNGGTEISGIGRMTWDQLGANYDTEYKSDGKYYSNKLIVLLSDKWMNEKLTTEVQGIWGIERNEFMVAPKIEYNVTEGLTFAVRGVYLYSNNEDGEFYNFTAGSENHDKAFVQLTAKYQF